MKATHFTHWWNRRDKAETGFWAGFFVLLLIPTAISLVMRLLPLWILVGAIAALLFVTGLFAMIDRDSPYTPR